VSRQDIPSDSEDRLGDAAGAPVTPMAPSAPLAPAGDRRARRLLPTLGAFVGVVATVAVAVLAEGWIVVLVATLGPTLAFLVVAAVGSAGAVLVAYAYDAEEGRYGPGTLVSRVRRWIAAREHSVAGRAAALTRFSEAVALLVLSVTVGPFLTAIAIKIRGGTRATAYGLCVVSAAVFAATWVTIYSGGLAVLRHLAWK
jgi:hypothetical protein